LAAAEQVSLAKLARNIKVPGFRKGKVPASVAAKHVNPSALQEQILENAISKAVAEAFINEDIQALERPNVEVKKFVPGAELEFTAEAVVVPPVKLGDYKNLKAKFLYFPDENHWVLKPQNALVWQREFFEWLKETL